MRTWRRGRPDRNSRRHDDRSWMTGTPTSARYGSPETVQAFLSAPERLSSWDAGMGRVKLHEGGLVEGAFPESGEPIWARIDADPDRNAIHYHLGPEPSSLVPQSEIRIVPGSVGCVEQQKPPIHGNKRLIACLAMLLDLTIEIVL